MRLLPIIGTSLGCSAVIAASLSRYVERNLAVTTFWRTDPVGAVWAAANGPGGLFLLLYAVIAFGIVTAAALLSLDAARLRLVRTVAGDRGSAAKPWHAAFEGTDLAPLASQVSFYELSVAPLSLLRILRTEIWRIYGKRLLATQTVTILLYGINLAVTPLLPLAPPQSLDFAGRAQTLAAITLMAGVLATWLLIDNAVGRLALAVTRLSAGGEAGIIAAAPGRSGSAGSGAAEPALLNLVSATERLIVALEQKPQWLAASETAMRDAAERQNTVLSGLLRVISDKIEGLGVAIAQAKPETDHDVAQVSEAMTQLAASVEKLADPVLRRIKLLGTTDRRLLTVLQNQEQVVSSVGHRWSELVAALQAMSSGLETFARATAQQEPGSHLVLARPGHADPADLSDELQDLLDEMSEGAPPAVEQHGKRAAT